MRDPFALSFELYRTSYRPQIDYTIDVLLPFLHRHFGIAAQVDIIKRGYFPRGGGQLKVTIDTLPPSQKVPPLDLTVRGDITRISGKAYVAGRLSPSIAREVRDAAVARLSPALPSTACIEIATVFELEDRVGGRGFGSGILLYAHSSTGCVLAGDSIGKQGKAPSETGQEAADRLLEQIDHGGCVDEHLQVCLRFCHRSGETKIGRTGSNHHLHGAREGRVRREDGSIVAAYEDGDIHR